MKLVPKKKEARIGFYQAHIATWAANAVAMGASAADVTAVQTALTTAVGTLEAQRVAQTAAKSAVQACDQAVARLNALGMVVIEQVRTKARTAGDGVYTLADLPVPATPAAKGAPGKSTDFTATLNDIGGLELKWKCPNPAGTSGTIYQIFRLIGESVEPIYIGGAGSKTFVDSTLPAGVQKVTYQIQAVRSTAVGPWAAFTVKFGAAVNGVASTQVIETQATPKMAA
ncbi:MAG TPA: hypothetical protein VGN72_12010 [Tepidisphaeraceae bacterium]|jgi:hypothetical protein|nr:hypothetical protein [Tepidisphaeraceae bacterium]